jgi:signal transduction histidine kinase
MGMGVGLTICHGIIEDHNGFITAENDPAGGAIFTIRLPLNRQSAQS